MNYPPPVGYDETFGNQKINSSTQRKKTRNSNLELYRIIVMLLIVAHHYVVNSGLIQMLETMPASASSLTMILFGAWGKTGINCFMLITCYFMCKSNITGQKLLKLYVQIAFYSIVIYAVFLFTGHEHPSIKSLVLTLFPIQSFSSNFIACFLVFYLLIPFLNILINGLDKKKHETLLIILLCLYTMMPLIPGFSNKFTYVTWFSVLYILGSYIRLYGIGNHISHRAWGWLCVLSVFLASASVLGMIMIRELGYIEVFSPYHFVADSNKIFALAVALTSFMWFKDLKIQHSRLINAIGGATFGVLLIHANSNAMRQWLWRETVDCTGHFSGEIWVTLSYAIISVILIFTICAGIDWFRGRFIEPHLMRAANRIITKINLKLSNQEK